jgi:hypothetical protein
MGANQGNAAECRRTPLRRLFPRRVKADHAVIDKKARDGNRSSSDPRRVLPLCDAAKTNASLRKRSVAVLDGPYENTQEFGNRVALL